jgi:hypothetical protein
LRLNRFYSRDESVPWSNREGRGRSCPGLRSRRLTGDRQMPCRRQSPGTRDVAAGQTGRTSRKSGRPAVVHGGFLGPCAEVLEGESENDAVQGDGRGNGEPTTSHVNRESPTEGVPMRERGSIVQLSGRRHAPPSRQHQQLGVGTYPLRRRKCRRASAPHSHATPRGAPRRNQAPTVAPVRCRCRCHRHVPNNPPAPALPCTPAPASSPRGPRASPHSKTFPHAQGGAQVGIPNRATLTPGRPVSPRHPRNCARLGLDGHATLATTHSPTPA